ncbi:hypothetical protein P872_12060 [Rhodonellum psychrophilum GCM71 = DSM 17998]|uniref:Uncharacterized protein n=1 Tax=Rhodonellum psychrophilum GCM71 = DSM 17998 TaxID=1123057 RepID=U5BSR3_9BACT|nr:hypothetical protein P872_12060 [Rhodonellum psychrophilum GCM71 = DSM 17998]
MGKNGSNPKEGIKFNVSNTPRKIKKARQGYSFSNCKQNRLFIMKSVQIQ